MIFGLVSNNIFLYINKEYLSQISSLTTRRNFYLPICTLCIVPPHHHHPHHRHHHHLQSSFPFKSSGGGAALRQNSDWCLQKQTIEKCSNWLKITMRGTMVRCDWCYCFESQHQLIFSSAHLLSISIGISISISINITISITISLYTHLLICSYAHHQHQPVNLLIIWVICSSSASA